MSQQWNRYKSKLEEYRGGIPVWVEIPKQRVAGGFLKNKLRDMEVLASGSPMEFDHKTKEAKILKLFKVESVETDGTDTIITILRTRRTPELYSGMNVMVVPANITSSGKAVTLSDVDDSAEGTYKITVETSSIASVTANSYLAEAASAGASVKMFAIPNTLTIDDTVGGDQNTVGVPRGMKYLYENCIPSMPDNVKNAISYVEWEHFPEI